MVVKLLRVYLKISMPFAFVTLSAFQLYIRHGVWVLATGPRCTKYN